MTTLYRNGTVHTAEGSPATALRVDGDRIGWIGTDPQAEPGETVIDLDGAWVAPAFVDAHVHATSTGLALEGLNLSTARTLGECLDQVAAFARRRRGGVVLGHGWDESAWPERRPPTRQELDRASYGGVVYLSRIDVHSAAVSSALLAATPEAAAERGFSDTGHLTMDAHHVVRRVARESVSPDQRRAAQRATRARAAQLGIGCFHELGGPDISSEQDFREVMALAADEPGPDVVGYWGELGGSERARELGALGAAGDLFADGAIGSHTACLRTVYADGDHSGHAYLTAAQVRDHVVACTRAGLQAGFHAIGDGALEAVTAGFREAAAAVGADAVRAARHRLEHVEMVDAPMIATLADLGVVASVQPLFDALWGGEAGMYAERLGLDRARTLNPFASMAAAGVVLALGSDSPVTPLGPWEAVRAAAYHHTTDHRISVTAAFDAHTQGGWRAVGRDAEGVLDVGRPATFAAWAGTGGSMPDVALGRELPTCLRTVVRGHEVFAAGR